MDPLRGIYCHVSVLLVHFFYINTYYTQLLNRLRLKKSQFREDIEQLDPWPRYYPNLLVVALCIWYSTKYYIYIKSSVRFYYRSMEIVAKPYHVVLQLDPQEFSKMPKEFVHVTELLCGMKETNPWLDLEGSSSKGINYEEEQITQRKLNSYLHLKYAWQSYTHVMC